MMATSHIPAGTSVHLVNDDGTVNVAYRGTVLFTMSGGRVMVEWDDGATGRYATIDLHPIPDTPR